MILFSLFLFLLACLGLGFRVSGIRVGAFIKGDVGTIKYHILEFSFKR